MRSYITVVVLISAGNLIGCKSSQQEERQRVGETQITAGDLPKSAVQEDRVAGAPQQGQLQGGVLQGGQGHQSVPPDRPLTDDEVVVRSLSDLSARVDARIRALDEKITDLRNVERTSAGDEREQVHSSLMEAENHRRILERDAAWLRRMDRDEWPTAQLEIERDLKR